MGHYLTETDKSIHQGYTHQIIAKYESELEHSARLAAENRPPASLNIGSIGAIHGSILGSQHHATINTSITLQNLELEIERRGGADAEDLKQMVREIAQTLEQQQTIEKGTLSRFSALMERHSWVTGAIAQALLGYALGGGRLPGT